MLTVANRGNNFDVNGDYDNWRSRDHSIRKKPKRKKHSPSAHCANSSNRRNVDRNERLAKRSPKGDPNERARILGGILSKININPNRFALFKEEIETRLEQFAHDVNLVNYASIVSKFFCSSGQNLGRFEKSHHLSPEQQDFMVSILGRAAHKMKFDNTKNMQALTNLIYALVYIDYDPLSVQQKNNIKNLMDQVAKKIEKIPAQYLNKQDFILASEGCSNLPTELVEDFLTLLNDKLAESKIKLAPNDFYSLLISYACHEDLLQGFFDKNIYKLDTEGKWSLKTLIVTLDKLSKIHKNQAFFSLLNTLKNKIINYPDKFNFEDIATVLKLASSIGPDFVQQLLPRMNKDLQETKGSLNKNQIGAILFSIAQCDPSDEINSLLKTVLSKFFCSSGQNFGRLEKSHTLSRDQQDFLTLLNDKLAESNIKLAPDDFCSLLISYACHEDLLQGFFDKNIDKLDTEGKWSLKTLIVTLDKLSKIHNNKAFFSLLNTLKNKIINYQDNFNFEDLATVLKLASSIGPNFVQELLPRMNEDLQKTKGSLNKNQLAQILFSIAQCDSSVEINSLLEIVSEKLPEEQELMTFREISQSFGGLRNHEFAVPDKLWSFLKEEFLFLKDRLQERSLNYILLATQNHKAELPKSIFSEAATILLDKIQTVGSFIDQPTKYFSQLARILRSPQINKRQAKIVIDYFKKIPSNKVLGIGFKRELHLLAFLRPELKDDLIPLINQTEIKALPGKQSLAEKLAEPAIREVLPNIKAGQYIDGIELDFYDEKSKINIEIDGVFHQGWHKFEDAIRDKYLKKVHNIKVFRIKLPKTFEIDPGDNYLEELSKAIDSQLSELKPKLQNTSRSF
jgi:very-short-patch-repair endonuclease/Ca2+-binding EF-hand superfamily protein